MTRTPKRDHGGNLDQAIAQYGGDRRDWIDLSTGINPVPYPVGPIPSDAWTRLPDARAMSALETAARQFWNVPDHAGVVAANGASALIARLPEILPKPVFVPQPTYNEHAAALDRVHARTLERDVARARIIVHPNNPDGLLWPLPDADAGTVVIDESFCDTCPEKSHIGAANRAIVLKSFGKFWGLAGLRLGFVIGPAGLCDQLRESLGPWQVSGPALEVASRALADQDWATETRVRLKRDADQLDQIVASQKIKIVGGTSLFRLYEVENAQELHAHLAQYRIWSRVFPYNPTWIRLGLPHPDQFHRISAAF